MLREVGGRIERGGEGLRGVWEEEERGSATELDSGGTEWTTSERASVRRQTTLPCSSSTTVTSTVPAALPLLCCSPSSPVPPRGVSIPLVLPPRRLLGGSDRGFQEKRRWLLTVDVQVCGVWWC